MLLSIEEGLVSLRPAGAENERQERRNRISFAEMGPMNEERAALLLEAFHGMMRRANTWREMLQSVRAAGDFLSMVMEVTLNEARRVFPQGGSQ